MSLIYIKDDGGCTMELVDVDGFYIHTFMRSAEATTRHVHALKDFNCRPDDIFVCASMKSGTHWVWEIISMLGAGKAESIPKSKVKNMLEATPPEDFDDMPSPRVLNTHVGFKYMPKSLDKQKIVFVLRNPKDVMVSHYNHVTGCKGYKYDGKWENFFRLFMDGKLEYNSWFDYTREWYKAIETRTDLNIHVVYYEDLKQNTLHEINRLGQFLGIEDTDDLFAKVTKKSQFGEMVKDKRDILTPEDKERIFQNDFSLYRKGEHGDWMNWFTVAQSEFFDRVYQEKMADVKFNFRFRPPK